MADIQPFIVSRYAPELSDDLDRLLTPPYDVIGPEMQEELYKRHAKNLVRVDFGTIESGDNDEHNRYTRAAELWKQWNAEGTIMRSPDPEIHVCEQEFDMPGTGRRVARRGFFCAVRLKEFDEGGVSAHEHTFEGPKADRLKLTRATDCNISPIFCIFDDPKRGADEIVSEAIAKMVPLEATIDGIVHRQWVIKNPDTLERIMEAMKPHDLYIADGHHRYETALNYRRMRREETGKTGGDQPFDYTLMFLANIHDPGMSILPTHRVFSSEALAVSTVESALSELKHAFTIRNLDVEPDSPQAAAQLIGELEEAGKESTSFVMVTPEGPARLLELRRGIDVNDLIPDTKLHTELKKLDVTLLHRYIIYRVWLDCPAEDLDDSHVTYVKDPAEALRMVRDGKHGAAFLLNATKMEQVIQIAGLGMRMPHKSTYFFPKIITGMVIRDMAEQG